jgi:hypothetical protein
VPISHEKLSALAAVSRSSVAATAAAPNERGTRGLRTGNGVSLTSPVIR